MNIETKVKEKLAKLRARLIVVYISFAALFLSPVLLIFNLGAFLTILIISLLITTISGVAYGTMWFKFCHTVRSEIMKGILDGYFDSMSYNLKGHNSGCQGDARELIEGWSLAEGSDLIQGVYKGLNFEFSNLNLFSEASNGNKTPLFIGQWLTCCFNIPLKTPLVLRERNWNSRGIRGTAKAKAIQKQKPRSERDKKASINTESIEFNNKYFILSEDAHMAFYVLTPHFMEFLVQLDERVDADTSVLFAGNKAYFAFNSGKSIFEIKTTMVFNNDLLNVFIQQCHSQAQCIKAIIDELLINEVLFGKG